MSNIDFLPERIKLQRQRKRRLIWQGYCTVACAGLLVLAGYLRQSSVQHAQAALVTLDERSSSLQRQLALRAELEKQQAELMIMQQVESQLGSRVNALDVLAEMERLLPEAVSLTSMDLDTMEVRTVRPAGSQVNGHSRPTAASAGPARPVKRVRLVITGVAPSDVDVANFIGQLSASPLFEDVNMGFSRNLVYHGHMAREFQTSCYVRR